MTKSGHSFFSGLTSTNLKSIQSFGDARGCSRRELTIQRLNPRSPTNLLLGGRQASFSGGGACLSIIHSCNFAKLRATPSKPIMAMVAFASIGAKSKCFPRYKLAARTKRGVHAMTDASPYLRLNRLNASKK